MTVNMENKIISERDQRGFRSRKKYLAFLIPIIMTVSLLGCGSSSENDSVSKKPDDIALISYARTVFKV